MQLAGMIRSPCPPAQLVAVLDDPDGLTRLLPGDSDLRQTAAGQFAFTLRKPLGPLTITMPGTLTVTALGTGHDRHLVARAAHLIAGKVDITLDIRLTAGPGATVMAYEGELTASGLAGRLLGDNSERAQNALRSLFLRLKRQVEADQPPGIRPQGKAALKG